MIKTNCRRKSKSYQRMAAGSMSCIRKMFVGRTVEDVELQDFSWKSCDNGWVNGIRGMPAQGSESSVV